MHSIFFSTPRSSFRKLHNPRNPSQTTSRRRFPTESDNPCCAEAVRPRGTVRLKTSGPTRLQSSCVHFSFLLSDSLPRLPALPTSASIRGGEHLETRQLCRGCIGIHIYRAIVPSSAAGVTVKEGLPSPRVNCRGPQGPVPGLRHPQRARAAHRTHSGGTYLRPNIADHRLSSLRSPLLDLASFRRL